MEALTGESTKMVRKNGVYVCDPERDSWEGLQTMRS